MALNGSPTKTNSSLDKVKVLILFVSRTLNPYNQSPILKCYCIAVSRIYAMPAF